ncbi:MAG: prolyl oligopeptidase family serine peptidase [Acidobacteria bacterium]|nr:prolyl oligopeptidase family serine peptidase [Acidobacteriota bacterium]
MKRMRTRAVLVLPLVFVVAALVPATAQNTAKRPIGLEDILSFRAMTTTSLSPDGKWFAYRVAPLEGDSEVIVRSTSGAQEWKFPAGEGAGPMSFSGDSMWFAMATSLTRADAVAARRARRPVQTSALIVNLSTGDKVSVPKIRRFAFSGEMGGWIAMHRYGPDAAAGAAGAAGGRAGGAAPPAAAAAAAPRDTRPRGTDLILRELKTGTELNVGNVFEFAFNKSGKFLALNIDAADQAGNGIQIRDMSSGAITSLETDKAFYERLTWTTEGDALSMLKGTDDKAFRERLFSVVGFTGFGSGAPRKVVYDPKQDKTFPADYSVSGNRSPVWTEDREALIFGIAELTKVPRPAGRGNATPAEGAEGADAGARGAGAAPAADATERPNLVVWHYKDPRLQTQQRVQENADRSFSYVTMYRPGEGKMIRIADDEVPDIQITGRGQWAIGTSDAAYERMSNLNGQRFRDVYAIDTKTGRKTVVKKNLRWGNASSPDTTKYLYYENKHFHVFDTATGTARNITEKVPTAFVNLEDDHNVVDPPTGVVGWASDNQYVLLSDRWDIWRVSVSGAEAPVNLTVNGRKDQIRYQGRVPGIYRNERGIDLGKPQYFSVMAEWTKRAGYGILEPGKTGLKMLLWEDAMIGSLQKAEKSDAWVYRKETPTEAPQVYVTDATLAAGRKIVDMAPSAESLAWSAGAQLIEFKNDKGERLQASLYLPANYEKGKSYPTIVYIYERLTQGHYQYGRPTANGFNRQAYTSNGYAVLQPDIKYYINDPGMSAAWTLPAAVKAAVATGVVDPKRVGLHGHSWGGYQTAFTITQSDVFAAAIAGAPLTNMISMYSIIYKNSGGTNGAIFESSQGRFTTGPWDNWAAYTRNSPVAHAKNVKTPLVILHNDQDGAVDFTQGVEYFNTLRRLDKPVVMLEYPGENHGLARPANQQDYTVRMKEFFDHFLKGEPAPDWWKDGVPRLDMQEHIDGRLKAREEAKKKAAGGGGK